MGVSSDFMALSGFGIRVSMLISPCFFLLKLGFNPPKTNLLAAVVYNFSDLNLFVVVR
jgi:hypothetical protein